MIPGAKCMISGCIDQMAQDGCSTCVRRDPCRALFSFFAKSPNRDQHGVRAQSAARALRPFFASVLEELSKFQERLALPRKSAFLMEVESRLEKMRQDGCARIDRLARAMGMSRQTLYRRLKAEGVTFEAILDGLRREHAIRLIKEGASVKDAAYQLGFSDPSAFSRAYKRWTGQSPKAAR
jgi:AraC-like DNA-binding protein